MGDDEQRRDEDRDGSSRGPEDTQFLDLEITQVLHSEAHGLAREAVRELLREGLKDRLRERLGDRLAAIARVAADSLADDIEANVEIERLVSAHRDRKSAAAERLQAAISGGSPGKTSSRGAARPTRKR